MKGCVGRGEIQPGAAASGVGGPLVLYSQSAPFWGCPYHSTAVSVWALGCPQLSLPQVTLSAVQAWLPGGSQPLGVAALGSPSWCSQQLSLRSAERPSTSPPPPPISLWVPWVLPPQGTAPHPANSQTTAHTPGRDPPPIPPSLYVPWAPELLSRVGGGGLPGSAAPADVTPGHWDLPACSARGHK